MYLRAKLGNKNKNKKSGAEKQWVEMREQHNCLLGYINFYSGSRVYINFHVTVIMPLAKSPYYLLEEAPLGLAVFAEFNC